MDAAALERHLDRLLRAALALCGSREEAEDAVQELCARVLARPRRLRSADAELPYLLEGLRNVVRDQARMRSRRPVTVELVEGVAGGAGDAAGPGADPAAVAEVRAVWVAIAALPEDQRDALVAVDVVGLSYAEAAALLGTREKTVATRLFRGRARVAEALRTGQ